MLGNPLDGSKGPPDFMPLWHEHRTWCFGAQYFFEIFNETANTTQAHAATGTTYNVSVGESIFTEFTLSDDWVWTLRMGVVGDPERLSEVVVPKPFMGLLPESQTSSWAEPVYSKAWSNTCWELYGIASADDYPQSNMRYTINISNPVPHAIEWGNWSTRQPNCPGHPTMAISTRQDATSQIITWDINRTAAGRMLPAPMFT